MSDLRRRRQPAGRDAHWYLPSRPAGTTADDQVGKMTQVIDAPELVEEETESVVEVSEYEVYCPQCTKGRTIIRPGSSDYQTKVPCQLCRPRAYARAMGQPSTNPPTE